MAKEGIIRPDSSSSHHNSKDNNKKSSKNHNQPVPEIQGMAAKSGNKKANPIYYD